VAWDKSKYSHLGIPLLWTYYFILHNHFFTGEALQEDILWWKNNYEINPPEYYKPIESNKNK
jgi:hypothetical protein